jgi:outer membrane biosynthesis protein TonB
MSLGSDASETISMAGEQLTYNNGAAEGAPPVAVKVKGKPGPKPKLKPGPKPKGKPGPKPKMKPGPKPKLKPGPKPKLKPGPKPKGKPGPKPKDPLKLKSGGVGKRSGEQHLREASSSQYPVDSEGHMAHDIATRPLTSQRVEDLVVFTLAVNTYVHTMQAERGAR